VSDGGRWSREEVELIVADYFRMLTLELSSQSYSKAAHRRALAPKLNNRSEGSIERKHQNISAVMIACGCHYVIGYKPLPNYQGLLFDVVASRLESDRQFHRIAQEASERSATVPFVEDFDGVLVDPPAPVDRDGIRDEHPELLSSYTEYRKRSGVFRDYLGIEARNRSLGDAGEKFVLAYEEHRLRMAGKTILANRIDQVSHSKGEGLGYDVLSFDLDGRERFIEVKATVSGKFAPFFMSANELEVSEDVPDQYHLYRVFEFRHAPRLFDLPGNVKHYCRLDPMSYMARIG